MENLKSNYLYCFSFEGLATRNEFWAMILIGMVSVPIALFLSVITPLLLYIALGLVVWYQLVITTRRMRATGVNMLWLIIFFIPLVNGVFLIILGFLKNDTIIET